MTRIAVVGAGPAGAATAYALRNTDAQISLFEERAETGGRTATRRHRGCRYDTGANYIKSDDETVNALIRELGTDGLIDVEAPVWTFDADGQIAEGRDVDDHKWTYREGITRIVERLLTRTDATLRLETPIEGIERDDVGWRVIDASGRDHGRWDAVVLTPPAPRTAELLADTAWKTSLHETLVNAIGAVPYRTILTIVLHYPFELDRPYYALVNTDRKHALGWVAREECKPGHVPDGESLLIVQSSPAWSTAQFDEPPEENATAAAELVADLLDDERLRSPDWTDQHGWHHALPDAGIDRDIVDRTADRNLFFAGDWVAGDGRVHLALKTGLDVADRIASNSR